MKVIITTCDERTHILKGFIHMFNKYWSHNADVTVLGYSTLSFDLPDNFKFISMGKQKKGDRDWTSALIPFFKQLSDEYFVLLLDDYYIVDTNEFLLREAEEFMAKGVEKIHLTKFDHLGWRISKEEKGINFNILKQNATYRSSLQPIFIRRNYFLKHLYPKKNIWQYESHHDASKNDGAQILVPKRNIVSFSHIAWRGKILDSRQMSKIRKEDLTIIKELGVF